MTTEKALRNLKKAERTGCVSAIVLWSIHEERITLMASSCKDSHSAIYQSNYIARKYHSDGHK